MARAVNPARQTRRRERPPLDVEREKELLRLRGEVARETLAEAFAAWRGGLVAGMRERFLGA